MFRTKRGIFGSAWMPSLGQAINTSLFQDSILPGCDCRAFQIIDDSVLISVADQGSPCDAHRHGIRMMELGTRNRLIEATDKRQLCFHGESLVFAGKEISSDGICHPIGNWFSSLLYFLQQRHLSTHDKRVFMGRANWLICHQPLARPFLNVLYPGSTLDCSDPFNRFYIFHFLALAAAPRSTDHGVLLNTPVSVQPKFNNMNRPYIFVDASFDTGLVGIIIQTPSFVKAIRYTVPLCFRHDQQAAELFGVFMALRQAVFFSLVHPILVGDNTGSLYSLLSLKAPTRRWWRLSLLQSISRLLFRFGGKLGYVSVRWLAGTLMPADVLSRNFSLIVGKVFNYFATPASVLKKIKELPPPPDVKASRPPLSVWQ